MSPASRQRDRVLLVAGSPALATVAEAALAGRAEPVHCSDLEQARERLSAGAASVVVVELATEGGRSPAALLEAIGGDTADAEWIAIGSAEALALVEAGEDESTPTCLVAPVDATSLRSAIQRALAHERLGRQARRLRGALRTMEECRQLFRCLEPAQLYPALLDVLLRATSRNRGLALFRRDTVPHNDTVALRGFAEVDAHDLCRLMLEEKPLEHGSFEQLEVIDRGPLHETLRRAGLEIGSLLVVPVRSAQSPGAVVCVHDAGRPFTREELDWARVVREHGIEALRNAEAYALAKERAFIDDVTEVYNARYLLSTCENEIQRAARYGNPLSVLFLDLDRFKLVNDRYGHLVGSETLRRLSKVLQQCVRQVDTLARYGGDEFTILLVDTAHSAALGIAERIRRTVEDFVFEVARDAPLRLTISIGVATCPEHGATREALLDSADKAMYRAKSEGRNRICSAGDLGG